MFIVGLLVVLSFVGGFWFNSFISDLDFGDLGVGNSNIVGLAVDTPEDVEEIGEYSWTTALCGNNNKCLDVLVSCNGTSVLNVTPYSKLIQNGEEWVDPRGGNPELCPNLNGKG